MKDIKTHLDAEDAWRKDYIFLPVNDNIRTDAQGGSHWSLLTYSRNRNLWYHFDSVKGANMKHAKHLAIKFNNYLESERTPIVKEVDCTQQKDSHSCGAFLLVNSGRIAERASQNLPLDKPCNANVSELSIIRTKMKDLITSKIIQREQGQKKKNGGNVKDKKNDQERAKDDERQDRKQSKKICLYWKTGQCRYKEKCWFAHPERCEALLNVGECENQDCKKLHPKICWSMRENGHCKRGDRCKFVHQKFVRPEIYNMKYRSLDENQLSRQRDEFQNGREKTIEQVYQTRKNLAENKRYARGEVNYARNHTIDKRYNYEGTDRESFFPMGKGGWENMKMPIYRYAAEILAEKMMKY